MRQPHKKHAASRVKPDCVIVGLLAPLKETATVPTRYMTSCNGLTAACRQGPFLLSSPIIVQPLAQIYEESIEVLALA